MKLKDACSLEEKLWPTNSILKSRDITLSTKVHLVKAMVFPIVIHVWMWELDYEESWAPKNWCFSTVVLEKTLESPLDFKVIKLVGDQSWIFTERTDVQAETPVLRPPDVKNWLIRRDLDAWKDWRQEEKQMTQYEAVGWHHWLNGQEFEQAPGAGDGQRSLVCCSPWGRQESDLTEWLNWTDNHITFAKILPHSQSCRSHSINTQSPDHIWWVKGIFGNSSIFYPCFLAWHIELSIYDYPFQISIALLQPDLVFSVNTLCLSVLT